MVESGSSPGRVLVVDDDPSILMMVVRMVEVLGFEVKSANDGGQALKMLNESTFDLVISDLMMPGIGGRELMETINALGIDASVLFISAAGTISDVVELMKLGAVGFIEKPFSAGGLRKEVLEAIKNRRGRKKATSAPPAPAGGSATQAQPQMFSGPNGTGVMAMPTGEPIVNPSSTSLIIDVVDPDPSAPGLPKPGAALQIGRYELRMLLGMGGMGSVYRAFDPVLGREVALKVIRAPADPDRRSDAVRRFYSEARAAAALSHAGIVAIHDFGEDPIRGLHYLVMELVRGVSLRETIRGLGPLSLAKAITVTYQLADALRYAHKRGVVHRDVKPENVLLVGERAKLVDFGIAKIEGVHITQENRMVGSPTYLSPEGARGELVDGRADQFSLATVLIEMLTGKRVFETDNVISTVKRVCDMPTPSFAELGLEVPPALQSMVTRMHAKEPKDRYLDDTELLEDLAALGRTLGLNLTPTFTGPDHR